MATKGRAELIQILSAVVMQHQSVPASEAVEILDRSSTSELADQFYRAVRSGLLQPDGSVVPTTPPAPTVTAADFEQAKVDHQRKIDQLRQQGEEKLARLQAERAADWVIHQQVHMKPRLEAEAAEALKRDKATIEDAYQTLRNFSNITANHHLIREVLGPGFSVYDIQNAISAGALRLVPPSAEEQQSWAEADEEKRKEYLLTRSPLELRQIIRQQADQRRAEQQHQQEQYDAEVRTARIAAQNFPVLPQEISSDKIKRADKELLKFWIKKFGSDQLTNRIRGIA